VPGVGTPTIEGASWGDGDRIVFATREGLWRVPASGGSPEAVSKRGAGEYAHKLPHVLPGGREALFTLQRTSSRWDDAQIVVRSLVTGEQKVLVDDGADARYVPSGHLVFIRRGTLMAIPFDLARLVSTGAPVAMIDGVMQAANNVNTVADSGAGQYAIAEQGRLIYVTGGITPDDERALVWVHRNGTVEPIAGAPHREYIAPRLAPDGRRIVVVTQTSASGDGQRVWIYDMARHTLTPLTSKKERSLWGVWSPDGAQIAFQTILAGRNTLSWKSADGAGTSETLRASEQSYPAPSSWSRDGKIAFVEGSPTKANDILVLDTRATDRRAQPVVQTPAGEYHPAFSPDGNWLAYTSNESGQPEVYVQPYPGPGPRVLVSTNGGEAPAWRGDGAELYYHYHTFNITPADGVLVMNAVPVTATAPRFSVGTPRRLFEGRYLAAFPARGYDVTLDGRRFLMTQMIEPPSPPRSDLVLVENWLEELRRRVR
jgi:serine/threonine-protein kinase